MQLAVWARDAKQCSRCRCDFNLFIRQHHCRRCGHIFCEDCSHFRLLIPPEDIAVAPEGSAHSGSLDHTRPLRVCEPCTIFLNPIQSDLAATQSRSATAAASFDLQRFQSTPIHFSMDGQLAQATQTVHDNTGGHL